jgi:CheY-like chemotaxis protein
LSATILNVDGRPENRQHRRRVLTDAGFRVVDAASAADALALLRTERPDVVLLDPAALDEGGPDLCRRIKNEPASARASILLVAANQRRDNPAPSCGDADAFVHGPVHSAALVRAVRSLLDPRAADAGVRTAFGANERQLRASQGPTQEGGLAARGAPRRETIMLVEDEDVLRRLARTVLERQGYRVVEANGPAEALTLGAQQPGSIDLVLADVLMPGMRGWEMVDRLRPQQPRARVLYMSGYLDEAEARDRVKPLILKPFKPRELLDAIRRVLDGEI